MPCEEGSYSDFILFGFRRACVQARISLVDRYRISRSCAADVVRGHRGRLVPVYLIGARIASQTIDFIKLVWDDFWSYYLAPVILNSSVSIRKVYMRYSWALRFMRTAIMAF